VRKLTREPLSTRLTSYLRRKQEEVEAGKDAKTTWKAARATRTMDGVFKTLCHMAGNRERCMYCEDSRGTDIEHFFPKAHFPSRAFTWENLLAICTGCNRLKGDSFALFDDGSPRLLDPTVDEPWDHLFYDSHTSLVTAAIRSGQPDERGSHTLDVLLTLNHEAITDGRAAAHRNLVRAVERFEKDAALGKKKATEEFVSAIRDYGSYGIADWCFRRQGSAEEPFSSFKTNHEEALKAVLAIL